MRTVNTTASVGGSPTIVLSSAVSMATAEGRPSAELAMAFAAKAAGAIAPRDGTPAGDKVKVVPPREGPPSEGPPSDGPPSEGEGSPAGYEFRCALTNGPFTDGRP